MEVTPEVVGKPEAAGAEDAESAESTTPEPKEQDTTEDATEKESSAPENIFSEGTKNEPDNSGDKTEPEESGESETGEWYLSEGVKGEGKPPEWFISNKYKSVAEQAKATKELRTEYNKMKEKIGEFGEAPESYSFDNLPEQIDKESPMLERFSVLFKNIGMSQKGFESIASEFVNLQVENAQISPQQIMKDVGAEGPEVFERVSNWARNTFSPEEQAVLSQVVTSADGLLLLDKMRGNSKLSRLPNQHDYANVQTHETSATVKAEKRANLGKYMSDENYAKGISRRLQTALIYEGKSNASSGRR